MNEEQFQEYRNTLHDSLEETILDIDERMNKKYKALEDKIDELNKNIKELINLLGELI